MTHGESCPDSDKELRDWSSDVELIHLHPPCLFQDRAVCRLSLVAAEVPEEIGERIVRLAEVCPQFQSHFLLLLPPSQDLSDKAGRVCPRINVGEHQSQPLR